MSLDDKWQLDGSVMRLVGQQLKTHTHKATQSVPQRRNMDIENNSASWG